MICLEKLNAMNVSDDIIINPFGQWIKAKREAKEWSVRRLANEAKKANGGEDVCSPSFISQLENNSYTGKKGKPMQADEDIVDGLAKALGESINEARIVAGHAPKNGGALPEPLQISDFDGFDPEDISDIKKYIEYKKALRKQQEQQ